MQSVSGVVNFMHYLFLFLISCKQSASITGLPSCKSDSWRRYTCTNVLFVCKEEVGELVQSGGGLPWSLLYGTTGRKELCMVPCHSCHIYRIRTSRSKKMWRMLKSHREGRLSLCKTAVLWNYCKSYWVYTVKDFIRCIFSLYYCCFICLRLARPKVQLKVS